MRPPIGPLVLGFVAVCLLSFSLGAQYHANKYPACVEETKP